MVTEVSIDAVKPAAYNPRKISKEQIKRSLEESGFEIVKLDW